jgi:hypothetical protein
MLGMTAGATRVYLQARDFEPDTIRKNVITSCIYMSLIIPVTLALLCLVPLGIYKNLMSLASIFITAVACAVPFYYAGIIVTAVLTKYEYPIGRLYFSDLLGASLGCLFALVGLSFWDAPSIILLCSSVSALAGWIFCRQENLGRHRRLSMGLVLFFAAWGTVNAYSDRGIRPVVVKGFRIELAENYLLERWNSFSRVAVYPEIKEAPQYWGQSPLAPQTPLRQYLMNIDGDAATTVRQFKTLSDIEHLRYDVTSVGYYLAEKGEACVVGVGGGRDVQSAILFGQRHVTGVEINPIFIDLLKGTFRDFAGIATRPDVTLVKSEAREYLSNGKTRYSIIQMALIDTWAATGAGAFSLSENALYTIEAWDLFLRRLDDKGIFTVSRWHDPNTIGETGRIVSLAVGTLLRRGVQEPSQHIALVTMGPVSTLIIRRAAFTPEKVNELRDVCKRFRYNPAILPGTCPKEAILRDIVSAKTPGQLKAITSRSKLNYTPTTDENPYFFSMLRFRNLLSAFRVAPGVVRGNLLATVTLLLLLATLFILTIATIVIPLMIRQRFHVNPAESPRTLLWGAVYFSLIGAGFMLTEIAMIQRLTVLISHPIYSLGVLLFTLIISTGIGSFLSDKLPLTRHPWVYVYPALTCANILIVRFLLSVLTERMITSGMAMKIMACVAVILPTGVCLGLFFPVGMRLTKSLCPEDTPWYWALNGIMGVLCSALAVFISIYVGISMNFYIAALCYLSVVIAQRGLLRDRGRVLAHLPRHGGNDPAGYRTAKGAASEAVIS